MNIKFGLMAGATVVCVVMTGCKAPKAQNTVRPVRPADRVAAERAPAPKPVEVKPVVAIICIWHNSGNKYLLYIRR